MSNLFSVTRKHFETPLGTVETDKQFAARLSANLSATPGGRSSIWPPTNWPIARSIRSSFRPCFLQYLLGERRPFKIVPVLVGSFHEFVWAGTFRRRESPEMRPLWRRCERRPPSHAAESATSAAATWPTSDSVSAIRRFWTPNDSSSRRPDDQALLAAACRADADGFFSRIAGQQDRQSRVRAGPHLHDAGSDAAGRGELLRYDQAVELDGTSCVSFGSAAFYGE